MKSLRKLPINLSLALAFFLIAGIWLAAYGGDTIKYYNAAGQEYTNEAVSYWQTATGQWQAGDLNGNIVNVDTPPWLSSANEPQYFNSLGQRYTNESTAYWQAATGQWQSGDSDGRITNIDSPPWLTVASQMFTKIGQQIYSALDRTFYLAAQDIPWIRPGLHVTITSVTIPSDNRPVVTFRLSDDMGQGLDREGKLTPGTVSTGMLFAYIPQNGTQYVSYYTRSQTSPITNKTELQAGTGAGTYTSLGDGNYSFKFTNAIPANFDARATHTLGIYANRNLTEFGLSVYMDNATKDFVPTGSQPTKIREVVSTAACNQCHDPLTAHGTTGRRDVEVCILCHTPQTPDPDTGNTTDMKVMIHKIHRGDNLPSVRSGKPYQIIGNSQSVHDFSEVAFPQDIRNCTSCHKDSAQVNAWMTNPTREACGSCHDDINWATGANHAAGAQISDRFCATCHVPQGELEYDASVMGAHTPEYKSTQLRNPKFTLLGITNTGPGQKPTVRFKVTDKHGTVINPATMVSPTGALRLTLAGPTSDYRWYVQEAADKATVASDGSASYTFTGSIPATATGSYALEAEGYLSATLNPGTTKQISNFRDAMDNFVQPFAVTGTTVTPRRTVVEQAKCLKCHDKLQLHGSNRNQLAACVVCHNPATTDSSRRPATANPPESIDMKILIHKIHTGEELSTDYTVYGFGGSLNNFNGIRYPGDRRDCLQCHANGTYTVPVAASATSVTTPRNYWDPTAPTAAACLGCHDSVEAAAHALINTASFGESCAVCHKETAEAAVSKAHAR